MRSTAPFFVLDALGPTGPYHAHERETITDVTGCPVAELSLVPPVYVDRAMDALHAARELPLEERLAALTAAAAAHATGTVNGVSAADHHYSVSRITGMPIAVVRAAGETIAHTAAHARESLDLARPAGAATHWRDHLTGTTRTVWSRRGDVLAVLAPGNHPAVHGLWIEALALGYRVAVRPSRRDPLTPHRLISALREAGFPNDNVVLLPTRHEAANGVLRTADVAVVYGGDDVMRAHAARPGTLLQGPGRSKVLVTADVDWRDQVDVIVDSASAQGGRACVNATAAFVDGDPGQLAQAVAERLAAIPSLPPEDDRAILPVVPVAQARALEHHLRDRARGTVPVLGGDGIVDELGDGSAVLRPAVHTLGCPDAEQAGLELPFPCLWIAPWSPADGVAPLRHTLVLTAMTHDRELVDALVSDPTIRNVHIGPHPTYWSAPGVPHDGYLAEFLMRAKAVIPPTEM